MNGFVLGVIMLAVGTGVAITLGVLAYLAIRNNIRFLLQGHKLASGRLHTIEDTARRLIAEAAKMHELQKCVQKLSSSLGQVKKELHATDGNLLSGDVIAYEEIAQVEILLKALATELGYEVKTVDEGPVPRVSVLKQVTEPTERKVSLVK